MPSPRGSVPHLRRFAAFLFLILVFFIISRWLHLEPAAVTAWLQAAPLLWSGLIFVGCYVGVTFFVWVGPKDILRVAAAAVYGPWISTAFVWAGEMGNLLTLFALSRRLGRGFVEEKLSRQMRRLDQMVSDERGLTVLFLRAFPIVPFRFLDLGFGLTRISLKKYFILSGVGSLPRIFFLQFYLSLGRELITDPQAMTAYLQTHPRIAAVSLVYALTALGMFAAMLMSRRRTTQDPG